MASDTLSNSTCPVCGSRALPYCEKEGYGEVWRIDRCTECGHGFVVNRPSAQRLKEIYQGEDTRRRQEGADPTGEQAVEAGPWVVKGFRRLGVTGGDVLDVGSGDGVLGRALARHGYRPILIDLDPHAAESARQIPGARFELSGFEEYSSTSGGSPLAGIVMSQVLEHALDPLDWLRRACHLLQNGGILAVALPNFRSVYRLLGARDPFICPPVHLNFFTPRSLAMGFSKAGLHAVRQDFCSRICTHHGSRALPWRRRAVGIVWNAVGAPVADLLRRGIMLQAYGIKPVNGQS